MADSRTTIIKPRERLLRFDPGEIWHYRDLFTLFVTGNFEREGRNANSLALPTEGVPENGDAGYVPMSAGDE